MKLSVPSKYSVYLFVSAQLILCCSAKVYAQKIRRQPTYATSTSMDDMRQIANELFAAQRYYSALNYYQKILTEDSLDTHSRYYAGESSRHLRDYAGANRYYTAVVEENSQDYPKAHFRLGMVSKASGQYNKAIDAFTRYLEQNPDLDKDEIEETNALIASCRTANSPEVSAGVAVNLMDRMEDHPVKSAVAPLPGSSELLFTQVVPITSRRKEKYNTIAGVYDTIYVTRLFEENETGSSMLDIEPDDKSWSIAAPALSSDGNRLYYSLYPSVGGDKYSSIHYSEKSGDSWSKPKAMDAPINLPETSSKQATLIQDPETGEEVMLFASNRPGGLGGFDLWYARLDENKNASAVSHLGSPVNSRRDEVSPYFQRGTNALFFSSDRASSGLGELDVYTVQYQPSSKTGKVLNLGRPVNSSADDYYFTINPEGDSGHLSSNRVVDEDVRTTCCNRIYTIAVDNKSPIAENQLETAQLDDSNDTFHAIMENLPYTQPEGGPEKASSPSKDLHMEGVLTQSGEKSPHTKVALDQENKVGNVMKDTEGRFQFDALDENGEYKLSTDRPDRESFSAQPSLVKEDGTVVRNIDSETDPYLPNSGQSQSSTSENISTDESVLSNRASRGSRREEEVATESSPAKSPPMNTDEARASEERTNPIARAKPSSAPSSGNSATFSPIMTHEEFENVKSGLKSPEDVHLRVQVGAYRNPRQGLFRNLKGLGKIEKEYTNGMTKFLIGDFTDLSIAESLRKKAHDRGVTDAFVAVYVKDRRVALLIHPY